MEQKTDQHRSRQAHAFDFNSVLEEIGHFGRFHWCQLLLLYVIALCTGIGVGSFAFTAYVPNYRCLIPQCEDINNATYYRDEITYQGHWSEDQLVFSHATEVAINSIPGKHQCERKTVVGEHHDCSSFMEALNGPDQRKVSVEKCLSEELVFDHSIVASSFATKFDMVCDNKSYLRGIVNACVMVGMLIGSLPAGMFSDRVGRKNALATFSLMVPIAGVVGAFATWLPLLAFCRVVIGLATVGTYISSFVLIAESTLPVFTNTATAILISVWPMGTMVVVILAYFIRDAFYLQLALYAPLILNILLWLFVHESPRWLLAKGRYEEAWINVKRIAQQNGKPLAKRMEDFPPTTESTANPFHARFLDLFTPQKMLIRTLICFYQWFCVTAVTYALIYASTSFVGSPYLNFAIVAFVGIPGKLTGIYTFDRVGRKCSLFLLQLTTGICCIAVALILENKELGLFQIVLASIAKFCSDLCFALVYLYCAEMYPTKLRGTATGACSTIGRVGGMFALGIDGLKTVWTPLPLVLIGSVTTIAAFLAFALPETTGTKLPETVKEALEETGKNYKLKPFCPRKWESVNQEET